LGDYSQSGLSGAKIESVISDFKKELAKIEADSNLWPWLKPSKIPASIAI